MLGPAGSGDRGGRKVGKSSDEEAEGLKGVAAAPVVVPPPLRPPPELPETADMAPAVAPPPATTPEPEPLRTRRKRAGSNSGTSGDGELESELPGLSLRAAPLAAADRVWEERPGLLGPSPAAASSSGIASATRCFVREGREAAESRLFCSSSSEGQRFFLLLEPRGGLANGFTPLLCRARTAAGGDTAARRRPPRGVSRWNKSAAAPALAPPSAELPSVAGAGTRCTATAPPTRKFPCRSLSSPSSSPSS